MSQEEAKTMHQYKPNPKYKLNTDAYRSIEGMGFSCLDVLKTFGEEVWENNNELSDVYSLNETVDAFIELMINQSRRLMTLNELNKLAKDEALTSSDSGNSLNIT